MTPEIESQRALRGGNSRRILLIAVGCVLWVGMVVGAVAFQWSKISQMRQIPHRAPPPVPTSPSWPSVQPPVASVPASRPLPKGPTPSELEARARAGDAGAALQLARMIERQSLGQAGLMKVAFEWRVRAAEAGNAVAMAVVARGYRQGDGVERDPVLAESWTERAVAAGGAERWDEIGSSFRFGLNSPQDSAEAAAWYRRALEKNLPSAQENYASLLLQGRGVVKDVAAARSLLESAVAAGNTAALVTLAQTLTKEAPTDLPRARTLYRDAASKKSTVALVAHGLFCQNGIGGPRDLAAARREFKTAVDLGDTAALMHLAEAMIDSDAAAGLLPDPGEARRLLEQAAAKNHAVAKAVLAKVEGGTAIGAALLVGAEKTAPIATDETRAAFDVSRLDSVPRPVFQARPRYPFSLRMLGVSGQVVVDFLVDREGQVQNAYAIRSTVTGFEAAAVDAVSAWRFEPGRKNGAAVVTHMQVPMVFTLNEEAVVPPKAGGAR